MTGKEHIDIFSRSRCLSENDLRAYAENSLSAEEKLSVEKHLVDCELCTDALEGYKLMNDPSEFELRTSSINRQIDAKSATSSVFLNREKLSYVAAAAVVLIFCSVVFVLIGNVSKESNQLISDEIKQDRYQEDIERDVHVQAHAAERDRTDNKSSIETSTSLSTASEKLGGVANEIDESSIEDVNFSYGAAATETVSGKPPAESPALTVDGNRNSDVAGDLGRETTILEDEDNFQIAATDIPLDDMTETDNKRKDSGKEGKGEDVEIAAGFYQDIKTDKEKERITSKSKKNTQTVVSTRSKGKLQEEGKSQVLVSKSIETSSDYSIVKSELSNQATVLESAEEIEAEEIAPLVGEEEPSPTPSLKSGEEGRPRYVGGNIQIAQYLLDNIKYPDSAIAQKIEGTVFVQFQVETDSSLTNVISLNDIGGGLDQEAVRVVKSMPNWIPARKNGKTVSQEYKLPVKFKLKE
ncbi:MAG: hypothetical protein COB85_06490 [Bacteroidetes bacterium]|nr:MAG: hypothetical protein COB85_06490 [Bacteroidota bacterium]